MWTLGAAAMEEDVSTDVALVPLLLGDLPRALGDFPRGEGDFVFIL
eukprot:CAMPEP_0179428872 /NCGR_PEP_ID=MMETSP0799-20121207/14423_1 /TAXON_ID=46947 /ORGANISM="Geminigera cryophila, Strain CCMP2564" /LENGTH=45 /DNA_ID=CAMNT_0021204559 /DNA_START=1609 /DNA_END=1743 /DNA_ORIENTATION=+